MKPRSIREKKSWRSVRETAMRKKPPPWSIWVATYERLGFFSPKMRAENGAMTMVTSELTPRIHPVHRRVAVASNVEILPI